MSGLDLDAVEARAAAATQGPWFWRERGVDERYGADGPFGMVLNLTAENTIPGVDPPWNQGHPLNLIKADNRGVTWAPTDADAEFIAASRMDVPLLVARVRELEAALAKVERLTYARGDGTEYEHNHPSGEGEAECAACWASDIRSALAVTE